MLAYMEYYFCYGWSRIWYAQSRDCSKFLKLSYSCARWYNATPSRQNDIGNYLFHGILEYSTDSQIMSLNQRLSYVSVHMPAFSSLLARLSQNLSANIPVSAALEPVSRTQAEV